MRRSRTRIRFDVKCPTSRQGLLRITGPGLCNSGRIADIDVPIGYKWASIRELHMTSSDLISKAPDKYLVVASNMVADRQAELDAIALKRTRSSSAYCTAEAKLEQAKAIYRAVQAITNSRHAMFSDRATLDHWIRTAPQP